MRFDAVFRKRSSSTDDSGEATWASAVNQILAILNASSQCLDDWYDQGTTRRGIATIGTIGSPLPDQQGRREILILSWLSFRCHGGF